MSAIWKRALNAINEAGEKSSLMSHIRMNYGDDDADSIEKSIDGQWNAEGIHGLKKLLTQRYVSSKIDKILDAAIKKHGWEDSDDGEDSSHRGLMSRTYDTDPAGEKIKTDPAAKKRGRPVGSGKKKKSAADAIFVDPEDAARQRASTAAFAASRPDRSGAEWSPPDRKQVKLEPGVRPTHDVGTAGQSPGSTPGHTRPVQKQVSQDTLPSRLPQELSSLRSDLENSKAALKKLRQDPRVKKNDPRIAAADKKVMDTERSISRMSAAGKSGVEDAQKRVDSITKDYGEQMGDQLASKLGVPTSKQRARRVKDPKGGADKIIYQVWNSDKVTKFLQRDLEIPADLSPLDFSWPGSGVHKPMIKAPRGMDKETVAKLSSLRHQYADVKKSGGSADELEAVKTEIDTLMIGADEMVSVVRPGLYLGQRWKPSGQGRDVKTTRPDAATGDFAYGTRRTDPTEEGQEVMWAGDEWVLPSVWAAKKGEMAADGTLPTGSRRPWQSGAQNVGGSAKSTSANDQKAQSRATAKTSKKSNY